MLVTILGVWQLGSWWGWFDPRLFASPARVLRAGADMLASGDLAADAWSTFSSLLVGTAVAAVVGEVAGLLLGRHQRLRWMFEWLLVVLNSMPRLAFVPIIILAVGIGFTSKTVVGFFSAVIPIALLVTTGVRQVPRTILQVAESLGIRRARLWWKVLVPASLPHLATGLRLGFSRALIGVVVTEMVNPITGLGRWIALGRTSLDPSRLIVAALLVGAVGTLAVQLISALERRLVR